MVLRELWKDTEELSGQLWCWYEDLVNVDTGGGGVDEGG